MKPMVSPIEDLLRDDQFVPGLRSSNKFEALEILVNRLRESHGVPFAAVSGVLDAVFREERDHASGLAGGIAVPRGSSDLLPASALIIGLAPQGIDFGGPDGSPSHVIILSLEGKGELPSVQREAILELLKDRPDLARNLGRAVTGAEARRLLHQETTRTQAKNEE